MSVYLGYLQVYEDLNLARTALTTVSVFCGLLLIVFAEPPSGWWAGGDELSGDWRPAVLAAGMLALGAFFVTLPLSREFFEFSPLRPLDYLILAGAAGLWAVALRAVWRMRLFERLVARSGYSAISVPPASPPACGKPPQDHG
jgi:cation-transporting ATPase E